MNRIFLICLCSALVGCGGGGGGRDNPVNPINQAPTVDSVGAVRIDANASGTTSVTINDDRTAIDDLRVEAVADNEGLFPIGSLAISSKGAQRRITLTPAVDEVGSSSIEINVTDVRGLSAATEFIVDVDPLTRNGSGFSRDLANLGAFDEPAFINAIEFINGIEDDDFADLLSQ